MPRAALFVLHTAHELCALLDAASRELQKYLNRAESISKKDPSLQFPLKLTRWLEQRSQNQPTVLDQLEARPNKDDPEQDPEPRTTHAQTLLEQYQVCSTDLAAIVNKISTASSHDISKSLKDQAAAVDTRISELKDCIDTAILVYSTGRRLNSREADDSAEGIDGNLSLYDAAATRPHSNLRYKLLQLYEQSSYGIDELESYTNGVNQIASRSGSNSGWIFQDDDNTAKTIGSGIRSVHDRTNVVGSDHVYLGDVTYNTYPQPSDGGQITFIAETVSKVEEITASAQSQILQTLAFEKMLSRRNKIAVADQGTFDWIMEPSQLDEHLRHNFVQWVHSSSQENGSFWIRGKPGSGKSTLMRHLEDDQLLSDALCEWAHPHALIRASYYPWASGTAMQKSNIGLLRGLLHQLLSHNPSSIADALPDSIWTKALAQSRLKAPFTYSWAEHELKTAIQKYVRIVYPSRMFFLIDGLDELDGTTEERTGLLTFLRELSDKHHVKFCFSSRPWPVFTQHFEMDDTFKVEDLTKGDMKLYVERKFMFHTRWPRLCETHGDSESHEVIDLVVAKAEGVFLWVYLVVQVLLKGLTNGDNLNAMKKKIKDLPPDLPKFFKRMIGSIEPEYQREASSLLQLMSYYSTQGDHISGPNTLRALCLVDFDGTSASYGFEQDLTLYDWENEHVISNELDRMRDRITSRCMCLLEVPEEGTATHKTLTPRAKSRPRPMNPLRTDVQFLHRTVADFLVTQEAQDILHSYTDDAFPFQLFQANRMVVHLAYSKKFDQKFLIEGEFNMGTTIELLYDELTRGELVDTPIKATAIEKVEQILASLADGCPYFGVWEETPFPMPPRSFRDVLASWKACQSNLLSAAITQKRMAYIEWALTKQSLRSKQGMPLLDYILAPGFESDDLTVLRRALSLGADPNSSGFQGSTPWTRLIVIYSYREGPGTGIPDVDQFVTALCLLIEHGAQLNVPLASFYAATTDATLLKAMPPTDIVFKTKLITSRALSNNPKSCTGNPRFEIEHVHIPELISRLPCLTTKHKQHLAEVIAQKLHMCSCLQAAPDNSSPRNIGLGRMLGAMRGLKVRK